MRRSHGQAAGATLWGMRRPVLLALWLLTDIGIFLASYALAYVVRLDFTLSSVFPLRPYMTAAAVAAPVWLLTLVVTRTFALTRKQREPKTVAYILYASLVGTASFALAYYFLYGLFFSRLLLVLDFAFCAVGTWGWHIIFGGLQRLALRRDPPVYPTLIVGVTREAAALVRTLQRAHSPLKPVAVLDGRGTKETALHGVPVRGRLHKLEETLERERITHLIQCSDLEHSINLLSACRERGITYLLLPSVLGIIGAQESVETLEGQPVTVVRPRRGLLTWFFA